VVQLLGAVQVFEENDKFLPIGFAVWIGELPNGEQYLYSEIRQNQTLIYALFCDYLSEGPKNRPG
jgi:hypothetical protein